MFRLVFVLYMYLICFIIVPPLRLKNFKVKITRFTIQRLYCYIIMVTGDFDVFAWQNRGLPLLEGKIVENITCLKGI